MTQSKPDVLPPKLDTATLLDRAFTQADYAINITDTQGKLVKVNQAYLDLYKFPNEAEVLGKTQRVIRSPHTPDAVYRDMWNTIQAGETWRGNLSNVARDGSEVFVHLTITPVREGNEIVGYMGFSLDRAQQVLEHLLLYSRKEAAQRFSTLTMSQLIEDSFLFIERQMRSRSIAIEVNIEGDIYLSGNRTQLESVVHNLLSNSRDAFDGRKTGEKRISIRAYKERPGAVTLEYTDNAGGIPKPILDRIFEPFFTTKKEREGTGLGLAISRKIVAEHGGTIHCESSGETTTFRITLPSLERPAPEPVLLDE